LHCRCRSLIDLIDWLFIVNLHVYSIRSSLEEYGSLGQVRLHQWLSHTRITSDNGSVDTHTVILVESNVGSADAIIEVTFESRPNTPAEVYHIISYHMHDT
jgi:hypothetical protein